MFTSGELYEVCRRVLLESLGTYYTDAHYHSVVTPSGTFRLSNYLDILTPEWRRNQPQEPQRRNRLADGTSCFSFNMPANLSTQDCVIVRPRDLADNFMKRAFLTATPGGTLDPNEVAILLGDRLIIEPSRELWLTEVYEALRNTSA